MPSLHVLLIEKMAIHLQDPFENKPTDTPMTTIATGIENNLMQLYGLENARKKWNSKELLLEQQQEDVVLQYKSKKAYYIM